MTLTKNEIHCTNIIWIGVISKLGGVESYAYYMAKKYQNYDIMVLCRSGDLNQLSRIREFCPAREWKRRENILQADDNKLRHHNPGQHGGAEKRQW